MSEDVRYIQRIENLQKKYGDSYNSLSEEEKEELHTLYLDKDTLKDLKRKIEKMIFVHIPPTPEEFLNPENNWLPSDYIDGLFDYIKKDFIEAMNVENPKSIICLYGSTRTGKSVMARLFTLYTLIYVNYLRDPHTYFKINKMSRLCIYLVSFKAEKTNQIYLSPILNLLDASDMFIRERFENNVYKNKITPDGKIHFSEATKFGDISFPNCFIVTGKDASSLVGADIISGAVSELTFFKKYAIGMSDDEIVQVFTKLYSRIQSTIGFKYFPCWSYIDSSANDSESPIEQLILSDLKNRKSAFFRHYVLWKVRPNLYPIWEKTKETFLFCTGDGLNNTHVIRPDEDLSLIPSDLVIDVPIDLYDTFKQNPIDSSKDIAGYPTVSENKFIQNMQSIHNLFNNSILPNIESIIKSEASVMPEQLIWNQIHHTFFIKDLIRSGEEVFRFKRASNEYRYFGFDNAHSTKGDVMGITCLHKEWSLTKKQVVYVADFCFVLNGTESGINLEAPVYFITDMLRLGQVPIYGVASDTFQSASQGQYLERNHIQFIKQSVDRELNPYQFLLTCLENELLKCGKNIFLKNNLQALMRKKDKSGKEKIDHNIGTTNNRYNGDWEKSTCGQYAKDASDSLCQALWLAFQHEHIPSCIYEEENKKFSVIKEDQDDLIRQATLSILNRNGMVASLRNTDLSTVM